MDLLDLFVKIGVKDEASNKISNIAGSIGNGLKKAAKIGGVAIAGITTAVAGVTAAMIKGTSATAEYADNIDKMSQKMGMSAEAYQEWDFIMQHSGTSMETLKASMKTMANAADTGSDAFTRLGITQEEIASLSQEDLFARTIEGLQGVENETERTALAGKLLGRGATELGPLLNTSAEDLEAMKQQVHDLGGVMSDEAVKAGAAFQDSLQNLHVSIDGLKRNFTSGLLPALVEVMDGLSLLISGDDSGFAKFDEGINDMVTGLNENIPKFVRAGAKIVQSLVTAILNNLPMLIESGMEVLDNFIHGIIEALPDLIDSAAEIILTFLDEIAEHPDEVIETAIELIITLASGIIKNLPKIIAAGAKAIGTLVASIIKHLPDIFKAGQDIIGKLIEGLKNLFSDLKEIGGDLIDKIKEGISDAWDGLKDWFNNLWDGLFGNREVDVNVNSSENGKPARGGLDYVPYDEYPVRLHKGEMVLTAPEADSYRRGGGRNNNSGVVVNQYIQSVPLTPVELASVTEAYFKQARWAI